MDRIVPTQAEVSKARPIVRKHALIPMHAEMTLKKWDDYRAAERARYASLSGDIVYDDDGNAVVATDEKGDYFKSVITDFPTPQRLRQLDEERRARQFDDALNDLYEKGAVPELLLMPLESAYKAKLIGFWEYRWRKLLHRFRGIWKPNATSGEPSARPTPGMEKMGSESEPTHSPSGTSSIAPGEPSST